jgi:hypothetical protein
VGPHQWWAGALERRIFATSRFLRHAKQTWCLLWQEPRVAQRLRWIGHCSFMTALEARIV